MQEHHHQANYIYKNHGQQELDDDDE